MLRLLEIGNDNGPAFSGKDTEDRYKHNLKYQNEDWIWRTKSVRYTLNSQNYRAPEWNSCDWNNSILIFGCSLVYGVGVDDSDTLSYKLSKLVNTPVINLGQGGTGISFAWANSIILREHNINPKAVIYVWPDRARQTEFLTDYNTVSHGAWNIEDSWMMPLSTNEEHNFHWTRYTIRSLRLLWNCPVIDASWHGDMVSLSNGIQLPLIDYARDLSHPGPASFEESSKILSEHL